MKNTTNKATPMHFKTVVQSDLPHGRNGKHKRIISIILKDLNQLTPGAALKIPLADLPDSKANVRSALNRAARKEGRAVATTSDETFLYIWNVGKNGSSVTRS
jgi:hypothetical protein